jgi:hypothetical protein
MIWWGSVRLKQPVLLEGRGWRSLIVASIDKVHIELTDSGYVNIYDAAEGGALITAFGPDMVLQLDPLTEKDE